LQEPLASGKLKLNYATLVLKTDVQNELNEWQTGGAKPELISCIPFIMESYLNSMGDD